MGMRERTVNQGIQNIIAIENIANRAGVTIPIKRVDTEGGGGHGPVYGKGSRTIPE